MYFSSILTGQVWVLVLDIITSLPFLSLTVLLHGRNSVSMSSEKDRSQGQMLSRSLNGRNPAKANKHAVIKQTLHSISCSMVSCTIAFSMSVVMGSFFYVGLERILLSPSTVVFMNRLSVGHGILAIL